VNALIADSLRRPKLNLPGRRVGIARDLLLDAYRERCPPWISVTLSMGAVFLGKTHCYEVMISLVTQEQQKYDIIRAIAHRYQAVSLTYLRRET
jgi:hypothetical protein